MLKHTPRTSERGAAMLAALCFCAVLGIALASYVGLCYRSLQFSNRTLHRDRGVQLAEMGMEDALWALNKNDWSGWTISGATATKSATGFPYENGATGQFNITITNYDGSGGPRAITAEGVTTLGDGSTVTRTVGSTTASAVLFPNAIAALSTTSSYAVRFCSGGSVDSYDSSLGSYASQTHTAAAVVSAPTVTLTDASIYGYVATSGATPSYSSNARVYGPNSPSSPKIDSSRISTSIFQPLFDVTAPSGVGTILPTGAATIGTPGATTPELYYGTNLTLSGSSQVLTIDGPVIISLSGNLSVSSSAKIVVTTNGSVEFHIGGDIALGGSDGSGSIRNDTQKPSKVLIAGSDTGNDTPKISTTADFYGVIYMPNDALTISSSLTIYGAIVAKTVYFSNPGGSPTIHYDTQLRGTAFSGVDTPFAVSDWHEISN